MGSFDFFAIWHDIDVIVNLYPLLRHDLRSVLSVTVVWLIAAGILAVFIHRYRKHIRAYSEAMLMSGMVFMFLTGCMQGLFGRNLSFEDVFVWCDYLLLYLTYVPVVLFSLGMIVSNIVLMKKEGVTPANTLAALMAVLQITGIHVACAVNDMMAVPPSYLWLFADVLLSCVYLFFAATFFGTALTAVAYTWTKPPYRQDFIIVLGCAVFGERVPPLLGGRIERAYRFYTKQIAHGAKPPVFILSGGQGEGEDISEAEAMRRYLSEKGVPQEHMLLEDQSRNTMENFVNSKKIIDRIDPGAKVIFSTTNYHIFRCEILDYKAGLRSTGIGARTKWYFMPNAFIREYAGVLQLKKKAMAMGIVAVTAVAALIAAIQWFVYFK